MALQQGADRDYSVHCLMVHRAAQALAVVVVALLLGLLVWKTTHNSAGKIASDVQNGEIVKAYPFNRPLRRRLSSISLAALRGKVVVPRLLAVLLPALHP